MSNLEKKIELPVVPRCHLPWQQMVIDSSGVVAPCCYWGAYGNDNPPLGNINEQTLLEIWNGERFQHLRSKMAAGDLKEAGCAKCFALKQGQVLGLDYDADADAETPCSSPYAQNIRLLKEEIAAGAGELRAKPTIISLTPSHRCNIRCTHCYQETTRSLDMARREAVDEVLELGPTLVRLIAGGGEPFLLPIWRRFLKEFEREKNPYLDFGTTTNATIVTKDTEEGLRKFKMVTLNISLDGTGKAFEKVRVGARFEDVRDNIRKLRAIAQTSGSPRSRVGATMCVMKSNILDMPNLIRFAAAEEIRFGLSPVATYPPDESLACFNNPHEETQGWLAAIEETRAAVLEDFFPVLLRLRNCPTDQSPSQLKELEKKTLQCVEVIRQATPWNVLKKEHHRVQIHLNHDQMETFQNGTPPGYPLMAYIFPKDSTSMYPAYYAHLNGDTFDVSVPEGLFVFNVSSKWHHASSVSAYAFYVKKCGDQGAVETSWQNPRLFRKLIPIPFWQQLRQSIKQHVEPYPRLLQALKGVNRYMKSFRKSA